MTHQTACAEQFAMCLKGGATHLRLGSRNTVCSGSIPYREEYYPGFWGAFYSGQQGSDFAWSRRCCETTVSWCPPLSKWSCVSALLARSSPRDVELIDTFWAHLNGRNSSCIQSVVLPLFYHRRFEGHKKPTLTGWFSYINTGRYDRI